MKNMRLFLAIDLPGKVKKNLDEQLSDLMADYPDFNWVTQENYHITLYFLGETDKVEKIKKKVEEATFDAESFRLYSLGTDLFLNHKIVLYVYFKREKKAEEIAEKIGDIFLAKDNKKYIPHLTFARYKKPSKQQYLHLKKKLNKLEIKIDFPVDKIYLFQSDLSKGKPIYKKIAVFPLVKQRRF